MKIVITGASGHIGTYLVPMLVNDGHEVISITRGQATPYVADPAWQSVKKIQMDRQKTPDFAAQVAALNPDVVVDLIAFHLQDTKSMVAALRNTHCNQYLFCSSCWAHGRAEVLPLDPDSIQKEPLDEYGREKFASEQYLKSEYREHNFPSTIIMPGQISGPGWAIINPWGNTLLAPFQTIANGDSLFLPNFGMETLHHVHGYDVAQCFYRAILHRNQSLGETFDATSGSSITLYGYARLMYKFFNQIPKIDFLPWNDWCKYVGDKDACDHTYYHIARSGSYSIRKEERLLDYHPRYSNVDTIKISVQNYVDRGLIKV